MTSSKHTPGPWTAEGNRPRKHSHNLSANARLIAAAPDLLEALKAVVSAWEVTGPIEAAERMDAAIHAARAAIAKAEAA